MNVVLKKSLSHKSAKPPVVQAVTHKDWDLQDRLSVAARLCPSGGQLVVFHLAQFCKSQPRDFYRGAIDAGAKPHNTCKTHSAS